MKINDTISGDARGFFVISSSSDQQNNISSSITTDFCSSNDK
jgi:hypothetical protein